MTQEELDRQLAALAGEFRRIGVPVSQRLDPHVKVNPRAKKRLGVCRHEDGKDVIELSAFAAGDERLAREILAHELLHTCPGCRNHGDKWKAWAALVNRELGFHVSRLASAELFSQGTLPAAQALGDKYLLRCLSCGQEISRSRMSAFVKNPERYRCGICGGQFTRVK